MVTEDHGGDARQRDLESAYRSLLRLEGLEEEWLESRHARDHPWPLGDDGSTFGLNYDPRVTDYGTITAALNDMSADLLEAIDRAGRARYLDRRVYVGEYPHESFNAQAMPIRDDGALILLNSGYFFLIHRVARIAAATIHIDPRGQVVHVPDGVDPSIYSTGNLTGELADALINYFDARAADTDFQGKYPLRFDEEGFTTGLLRDACEKWALAHEFGHVLAGHFNETRHLAAIEITAAQSREWFKVRREHETAADDWGLEILISQSYARWWDERFLDPNADRMRRFRNPIMTWLERRDRQCRVAGVRLYFLVADLVSEIEKEVLHRTSDQRGELTHPSNEERWANLEPSLEVAFRMPGDLRLSQNIAAFFAAHRGKVLDQVGKRLPRPGEGPAGGP